MTDHISRTPAGLPTGGQFASTDRPDGEVALTAPVITPTGISGSVGAWTVCAGLDDKGQVEIVAGRRDSSLVYSARATLFPVGWRVSRVWSPENPPKSVIALANRLAKRLP